MIPAGNRGVQVRAAREEDAEPLLRVLCAAFGLNCDAARPLFYDDPFFDLSHKRVLSTPEHGIVSCLTVIPATLKIGSVVLPLGGIAGVATHPEHQCRGYASHLLTESLRTLPTELGYPLTALFPFNEQYYRRLGWETVSRTACWSGFLDQRPDVGTAAHVRPLRSSDDTDHRQIRQIHALATREQTGLCGRDARRWQILETMTPSWEWFLQETEGQAQGYLVCDRRAGEEPIVHVQELIAVTENARRDLLAFLSGMNGGQTFIAWPSAPGLHALYGLPEYSDHLALEPGMMLRISDLYALLLALYPALAPTLTKMGQPLTIFAADDQIPQNTSPICLSASGVSPGNADDEHWMQGNIRTLAQLLTGYFLPSETSRQGYLTASSEAALSLADMLFPLRNPFILPADQF